MLNCFQLTVNEKMTVSRIYYLLHILHFYLVFAFTLFAHNSKTTRDKDLYELEFIY